MTFKKGESGNIKGRTPGSGKVAKWRGLLESRANDLIGAVLNKALDEGDPTAMKLCMERIVPAYRNESRELNLPRAANGTFTQRAVAVVDAIAEGEVEPHTGTELLQAIATAGKVEEMEQLKQRIEALELAIKRS